MGSNLKKVFISLLVCAHSSAFTNAFSATHNTKLHVRSTNAAGPTSIEKLAYLSPPVVSGRSRKSSLGALAPSITAAGILYQKSLITHPLTTKLVTGATLALIGDAIAQSNQNKVYDERKATSIVVFDVFYRSLQCVLFPLLVKLCQGQYFGKIFRNASSSSLAAWEQTLGE